MANNKIVLEGGEVLIDLTADTATAADVASGATFHDKSGELVTGTSTKDSDTSDATVAVAEMLTGKTAYARGAKLTGTMPNNGAQTGSISTKDGTVSIKEGYHDGSGKIGIASGEKTKLIPANIRHGVTLLGVVGTMSVNEGENPEVGKTVKPTFEEQSVVPSGSYTCFKELTVEAIKVTRTPNAAGGTTVTIG